MSARTSRAIGSGGGVPWSVPAGLFAAWLLNDAEEWFTMGPWSRRHLLELLERLPGRLKSRLPVGVAGDIGTGISDRQARASILLMGVLFLAATGAGVCTRGRSPFFQVALIGFGLHGFTHLGASAVARGYTPGVLTAPTVVLPYSAWAVRSLLRAGVLTKRPEVWVAAGAAIPVVIGGAHLGSRVLSRIAGRWRR